MGETWGPKYQWLTWLGNGAGRLERRLSKSEKPEQRVARLQKLLDRHIERRGADSYPATMCRIDIAQTLEGMSRMEEAASIRRETHKAFSQHFGEFHSDSLTELMYLAHDLYESGREDEAFLLLKSLRQDGRWRGTDDEMIRWADALLASNAGAFADGPVTHISSSVGPAGGRTGSSSTNTARVTRKTGPSGDSAES